MQKPLNCNLHALVMLLFKLNSIQFRVTDGVASVATVLPVWLMIPSNFFPLKKKNGAVYTAGH